VSRPRPAAAWSSVRSARQEIRIDLSDRFGKVGQFYFDAGRIKELRPFAVNDDRWLSPSKHHVADAGIKDE
jgi:hypothetical protein